MYFFTLSNTYESSKPVTNLDITDYYNHYIRIATKVQLLNDDPGLSISQLRLSPLIIVTEIIARRLWLKQFPKSAITKRNPPLCYKKRFI